tara:strand:+ start:1951 stop:2349 length:399 start_codon:yes stop_codon:yes gene_type:complete
MKKVLLLIILVFNLSNAQSTRYADKESKAYIEAMEGNIYRISGASHEEGFDGVGYTTTYSNPFYTGYFTIKDGLVYKCTRKGVIEKLYFNEYIYVYGISSTIHYIGAKMPLISALRKYKKYIYRVKKQIKRK